MDFDKKLYAQAIKIYRAIESLHGCCADIICKKELKSSLKESFLIDIGIEDMTDIDYDDYKSILFIIYETLRLSKQK